MKIFQRQQGSHPGLVQDRLSLATAGQRVLTTVPKLVLQKATTSGLQLSPGSQALSPLRVGAAQLELMKELMQFSTLSAWDSDGAGPAQVTFRKWKNLTQHT